MRTFTIFHARLLGTINLLCRFTHLSRSVYDWGNMKVRDVIKLNEADGWRLARQRGSHMQYKHPNKKGLVTIAGNRMLILRREL